MLMLLRIQESLVSGSRLNIPLIFIIYFEKYAHCFKLQYYIMKICTYIHTVSIIIVMYIKLI